MGGPAAIVSATAATAPSSSEAGVTALTKPSSSARSPLTISAVKASCFAYVRSDPLTEEPRGPEVEAQPPLGEDGGEPGAVGAPGQIRRQREPEPGPDGHAVDLGDDRHRAVVHRQDDVAEHAHRVEVVAAGTTGAVPTPAPSQIGTGAELTPRTGQHHDARAGVGDLAERGPIATHRSPVHAFFDAGRSMVTVVM